MQSITRTALACLFLISLTNCTLAQAQPCSDSSFRDFDFWVGQWDVYDNSTGNLAGSNTIEPLEQGCGLMESWTGAGGSTGVSINYFNPVRNEWRQLWVSAGQYAIDIAGGLANDSMVLSGELYNYANGESYDFRGTWTPNADGSVRQFFEQFNPDNQSWEPWFDGRYERKTFAGVYRPDGSLQCQDGGVAPEIMARELTDAGIPVACMQQGNDGLMHMAMCGAATGEINIFEISTLDLPAAMELGFMPLSELDGFQGSVCE